MVATAILEKLRGIQGDMTTLVAKGINRTDDENRRLAELVTEGRSIKSAIDTDKDAGELLEWATRSGGMLPLAAGGAPGNGTMVDALHPAGGTTMELRGRELTIAEQYGEGVYAANIRSTIGTDDYRTSFTQYLRKGEKHLRMGELRTLQEGVDTSGGFLVPADILDRVVAKEPTPTRVVGQVTQLQTSRDTLVIPRVNYTTDDLYTTGMRVTWTGEIPASNTASRVTEPIFGQTHIPIYTAMMSITVTVDQIEDTAFPLVSWLSSKFSETIDLLRDNMVLNGTGIGQPSGILVAPNITDGTQPSVIVSGSSTTIGTDGTALISLAMSLPEQYDDRAVAVMNKTNTALAVAQLKDSNGRFLWGSGLQDSGLQPNWKDRMLLGYPVVLSGFMPNIGASTYPIIFGDFRGYYLVNRIGFSVQVLRELYAETNQVLILGRVRFGGQVVEPWKLKIFQCHS